MTAAIHTDYSKKLQQNKVDNYQQFTYDEYQKKEPGFNTQFRCNFFLVSAKNVIVGGIVGAIIGALIASIIGIWNAIFGAKLGAVVGATAGGLGSYMLNFTHAETEMLIKNSYSYRKWKGIAVKDNVSKTFKKFLLKDPVLKDLVCPLSWKLPKFPLKAGGGTYDQKTILDQFRNKLQGSSISIDQFHYFTENDLFFDTEHYLKVATRVREIILKEIERKDLQKDDSQIIKDGLVAYMKQRDDLNEALYKKLEQECNVKFEKIKTEAIEKGLGVWETNEKYDAERQEEITRLNSYFKSCTLYTGDRYLDEFIRGYVTSALSRIDDLGRKCKEGVEFAASSAMHVKKIGSIVL